MRNWGIVVVLIFALAMPVFGQTLAKSGFLERVETGRNTGASTTTTSKFYWEGDRLRIERYTVGGLIVQIKDGRTYYIYNPASKSAVKTVVPPDKAVSVQRMLQDLAGASKAGKKVGAGKIVGINCDVYMISQTGKTVKAYISKDSRLPLPLKITVTAGNRVETSETRRVKLNYNVPDTMFALPKGTKVTESKAQAAPKK